MAHPITHSFGLLADPNYRRMWAIGGLTGAARWLEFVYGDRPEPDDPAEAYHEASKLTPSQLARQRSPPLAEPWRRQLAGPRP